jgi:hypothetical protein
VKEIVDSAAKRDDEQLSEAFLQMAMKSAVSQSVMMDLSYKVIAPIVQVQLGQCTHNNAFCFATPSYRLLRPESPPHTHTHTHTVHAKA